MTRQPFRFVAFVLALMLALPCVAYAVEPTVSPSAVVEDLVETSPAPVVVAAPSRSATLDDAPATENAFVRALVSLFGEYTPRTRTVTTSQTDGTTVETQEPIPGLAGLDWPWLASVALFTVVLVCLFKIVGVVAKK